MLHLFIQHTSAAITLNENYDPDVRTDMDRALDKIVPESFDWLHTDEGPDDSVSHLKTTLVGPSLQIPIGNGKVRANARFSSRVKRGNAFLISPCSFSSSSSGRGKGSRCASSVTTRTPAESSPPSCRSPRSARRCTDILLASNRRRLSQVPPAKDDCGTDEMSLGKEESFYTTHTGEKGGKRLCLYTAFDEESVSRREVELTQECATPRGWACTTTSPRERGVGVRVGDPVNNGKRTKGDLVTVRRSTTWG